MAETYYKKPMSVVRYDENEQKYLEMLPLEVTPDKNIIDYSPAQNMRPNDDRQKWEQEQMQQAMNKRSDVAKAIYNLADIPMSFANPLYGTMSGTVHTGLAAKDIKDNGLNWSNSVALGMGLAPLGFHVGSRVYGAVKKYYIPSENNLIGYGNYPGRINKLGPNLHLYPDFSKMTRAEKIQYLRTQKELAQRVDQVRTLDKLRMVKDRLREGGFDRIRKTYNEDVAKKSSEAAIYHQSNPIILKSINPKNEKIILQERPIRGTDSQISNEMSRRARTFIPFTKEQGGIGGTGIGFSDMTRKSAKLMTSRKANQGSAHEFVHFLYWPASRPKGVLTGRYLMGKNPILGSGEIAARGTELKNYFGLKEGEQLTSEMWDYARRHFLTDVQPNRGTRDLFNDVTNKPIFLKWLNKRAPVISGGLIGTSMLNSLNNE